MENGYCILSNYKVLVIKRETDNIDKILKRFNDYRDNIDSYEDFLDKDVFKYIKDNHFYE